MPQKKKSLKNIKKGNRRNRGNKGNRRNKFSKKRNQTRIIIPKSLYPEFHFKLFHKNKQSKKIYNNQLGLFNNYDTTEKIKLLDQTIYTLALEGIEKDKIFTKYFSF